MDRKKLKMILEILMGHYKLNRYLYLLGVVTDPSCRWWKLEEETVEHVLWHCPSLAGKRSKYLSKVGAGKGSNTGSFSAMTGLNNFLNSIGNNLDDDG